MKKNSNNWGMTPFFWWQRDKEKEPEGFWREISETSPNTWLVTCVIGMLIVAMRGLLDIRVFEGQFLLLVLGMRSLIFLYLLVNIWIAFRYPNFVQVHYQTLMVLILYIVGIPIGIMNALAAPKTSLYITGIAWVEFAAATLFTIPKRKLITGVAVINLFFIGFYLFLTEHANSELSGILETLLIFALLAIYAQHALLKLKIENYKRRQELLGSKEEVERRLDERTEELRRLAAYLDNILEEERKKVSREIHDEMGQILTGLRMDLSYIQTHLKNPDESMTKRLKMMSENVRELVCGVCRIASLLRPAALDDLGLAAAIEGLIERMRERTEILIDYTIEPEEINVDSDRSLAIFRILQEALNNAIRHAQATQIDIVLRQTDDMISLEVKDNGVGLQMTSENHSTAGLGVIGMKERVRRFDGRFWIEDHSGGGTMVKVNIPSGLEPKVSRS
jgi:signal transduction histidine kinase